MMQKYIASRQTNYYLKPVLGLSLGVGVCALLICLPASASESTLLDRPVLDRQANVILIPFHGALPRFDTQTMDNGTRVLATFYGSQVQPATSYKMGVFHNLVSRIEVSPQTESGKVSVAVNLTQPGSISVAPDLRRNMLRLQIGPVKREPLVDLSTPVGPLPIGVGANPRATLPSVRSGEYDAQMGRTGNIEFVRGGAQPQPVVSTPPVGPGSRNAGQLAGTPSSGEYVYRKAIPAANGVDVTEVVVRTGTRSNIGIDRSPSNDAVVVQMNPANAPAPVQGDWERPPVSEPWRQPIYRGPTTFKPVAAFDTRLGLAVMGENAAKFGSNFTGAGATLVGGLLQVPIGSAWNLRFGGETFAYKISSTQVPEAQTRRDEYFGDVVCEFLPIRRPWVLATGIGYWGRMMATKTNVLPPTEPSILFQPLLLWHGPALSVRAHIPVMSDQWAIVAEAQAAPYMFGLNDSVSNSVGNLLGYEGSAGLKYSARQFSVRAGYTQRNFASFNQSFTSNRGGPELTLVWRF